jgi:nicotinate-nucleotide pyrophosphorylase (carboxylating)
LIPPPLGGGTHIPRLGPDARTGASRAAISTQPARRDDVIRLEETVERIVWTALEEDVGAGDLTTGAIVDPAATASASILVKEAGVVCGLDVAQAVFLALDPRIRFERLVTDGHAVDQPPREVARIEGAARALLTGERTALNLLGRLSGIATSTRRYVDAVAGTGAQILDTRKTTPGLRALERHAVASGGGRNHRFSLDEAILIKDNHIRLAGGVRPAVESVRAACGNLPIEVEAETMADVREALDAGADAILLDNMAPAQLREAVAFIAGRVPLEASGGVTLETVRAIAETGVDFVSVGALTHSAHSLDVSLELR